MFVTPLYAGILTLWFVLLSVRVMNLRRRGTPFGDNNDVGFTRIVRAQANFAEYVPLTPVVDGLPGGHSVFDLPVARAWRDPDRGAGPPWPCAVVWMATALWPGRWRSAHGCRTAH